jgi:hypothetical protein
MKNRKRVNTDRAPASYPYMTEATRTRRNGDDRRDLGAKSSNSLDDFGVWWVIESKTPIISRD